jgi:hypothetical protein
MDLINAPTFYQSAEANIRRFIVTEGSHPYDEVHVAVWHATESDTVRFSAQCCACDRQWNLTVACHTMRTGGGLRLVMDRMRDWTEQIASVLCFKMQMRAELSEWITEVVRAAEPVGIRYGHLLQMASDEHLCSTFDVDVMLNQLGFVHEWQPGMHAIDPSDTSVFVDAVDIYRTAAGEYVHGGPRITLPADHPLKEKT